MFSRSVAWLLVSLVAVPFTAPFSTCDPSILLQSSPNVRRVHLVVSDSGRAASIEEASTAQAAVSVLDEEQFKNALLADASTTVSPDVRSVVAALPVTLVSTLRNPLIALRL